MLKQYEIEKDGQIDFFKNYGIDYSGDDSILIENTDGVYNGIIFEFKLNIADTNKVLFQAIKYLSKLRVKGENVPATILLISLNQGIAYRFASKDYIRSIQQVYYGAASKNNNGFNGGTPLNTYHYSDSDMRDSASLKKLLKGKKSISEQFIPVDIDENCILGWAERYYRECPNANKGDFIGDNTGTAISVTGEIREPKHFINLINPFTEQTNERFKFLMDCLNDRLSKKDLGAFYTPVPYAKKAAELVVSAVNRAIQAGKTDYIIMDRCAGTGNLESALENIYDCNGDELISHCVISTYEYYEYKVLQERLGQQVRDIIPPTEGDVSYERGTVQNADALSEEYINNQIIRQYLDNPDCAVILFENPPYSDSSAITFTEDGNAENRAQSDRGEKFVAKKFREIILPSLQEQRGAARESLNLFIWSGFHYFLRQDTDSFIVFSPVKYFKSVGLGNREFIDGFAFNRKFFHASESVISCIYWTYRTASITSHQLKVYDLINDNVIQNPEMPLLTIEPVKTNLSSLNDKRKFKDDQSSLVVCDSKGAPISGWNNSTKKATYNPNIIAYIAANGFTPDAKHRYLFRCGYKVGIEQSFGFYLRSDNFMEKLPLWVSKFVPMDKWYEKDVWNTSADGGVAYVKDKKFLKACLVYTCLSLNNKCLSFNGPDNKIYQNELCFAPETLSTKKLSKLKLDKEEKKLMTLWSEIITEAKLTSKYNSDIRYGIYQINLDLNTFQTQKINGEDIKIYDYPILNGKIQTLKVNLKQYYKTHIFDKMFKYELLK